MSLYGEQAARNMSEEQFRILKRQLDDVRGVKLPDLPELKAEELGDSAVGGMKSDAELRQNQLEAIAILRNIADKGGLDLSDQAAVEQAINAAVSQQKRARAGVASDAAARGQLNSGARLMMDMEAAQQGSNAARQNALEVAGMAQRRRLQAIRDAGSTSGGLREQDWREQESTNRAKDLREERNAAARERAAVYNAGLPQQMFTNALAKATGQLPSTSAVGNALSANAASTQQLWSGLGAAGNTALQSYTGTRNDGSGGGNQPPQQTYTYNPDEYGNRGGAQDISRGDEDK